MATSSKRPTESGWDSDDDLLQDFEEISGLSAFPDKNTFNDDIDEVDEDVLLGSDTEEAVFVNKSISPIRFDKLSKSTADGSTLRKKPNLTSGVQQTIHSRVDSQPSRTESKPYVKSRLGKKEKQTYSEPIEVGDDDDDVIIITEPEEELEFVDLCDDTSNDNFISQNENTVGEKVLNVSQAWTVDKEESGAVENITTDISADMYHESDSDTENEDRSRDRFRSERASIISLKASSRTNIPEKLEISDEQQAQVDDFINQKGPPKKRKQGRIRRRRCSKGWVKKNEKPEIFRVTERRYRHYYQPIDFYPPQNRYNGPPPPHDLMSHSIQTDNQPKKILINPHFCGPVVPDTQPPGIPFEPPHVLEPSREPQQMVPTYQHRPPPLLQHPHHMQSMARSHEQRSHHRQSMARSHEQHPHEQRPHEQRPHEERPHEQRPHEQHPHEQRPHEQHPHEQRPHEQHPHEERPHEQRPHKERPHEQRSHEQRPHEQRPHEERSHKERPHEQLRHLMHEPQRQPLLPMDANWHRGPAPPHQMHQLQQPGPQIVRGSDNQHLQGQYGLPTNNLDPGMRSHPPQRLSQPRPLLQQPYDPHFQHPGQGRMQPPQGHVASQVQPRPLLQEHPGHHQQQMMVHRQQAHQPEQLEHMHNAPRHQTEQHIRNIHRQQVYQPERMRDVSRSQPEQLQHMRDVSRSQPEQLQRMRDGSRSRPEQLQRMRDVSRHQAEQLQDMQNVPRQHVHQPEQLHHIHNTLEQQLCQRDQLHHMRNATQSHQQQPFSSPRHRHHSSQSSLERMPFPQASERHRGVPQHRHGFQQQRHHQARNQIQNQLGIRNQATKYFAQKQLQKAKQRQIEISNNRELPRVPQKPPRVPQKRMSGEFDNSRAAVPPKVAKFSGQPELKETDNDETRLLKLQLEHQRIARENVIKRKERNRQAQAERRRVELQERLAEQGKTLAESSDGNAQMEVPVQTKKTFIPKNTNQNQFRGQSTIQVQGPRLSVRQPGLVRNSFPNRVIGQNVSSNPHAPGSSSQVRGQVPEVRGRACYPLNQNRHPIPQQKQFPAQKLMNSGQKQTTFSQKSQVSAQKVMNTGQDQSTFSQNQQVHGNLKRQLSQQNVQNHKTTKLVTKKVMKKILVVRNAKGEIIRRQVVDNDISQEELLKQIGGNSKTTPTKTVADRQVTMQAAQQKVNRPVSVDVHQRTIMPSHAVSDEQQGGRTVVARPSSAETREESRTVVVGGVDAGIPDSCIVAIHNLSSSTNRPTISRLSSHIGPYKSIQVIKSQKKAIVAFHNPEHAALFVAKYNSSILDLSHLSVKLVLI